MGNPLALRHLLLLLALWVVHGYVCYANSHNVYEEKVENQARHFSQKSGNSNSSNSNSNSNNNSSSNNNKNKNSNKISKVKMSQSPRCTFA